MTLEDTTARPTVTRGLYSDRETFEQELRRIFGRCWLLVGFESEIPQPGDYVTRRMGADPVIAHVPGGRRCLCRLGRCQDCGARLLHGCRVRRVDAAGSG